MENTALATLTKDEMDMLKADREKAGSSFPQLPLIRLANRDMTQAPEGHYFVEIRKGGEEEPEIRDIGQNPEIIILYKTATYSYFTKEDGLVAWTTDICGYGPMDHVTLFVKRNGKVTIEKDCPYPEFRVFKEAKYTTTDPVTGKKKNLLKFKTVLYVLFEGKPHKMFVSNASNAGVGPDGLPSFKNAQPESLQAFTDQCWGAKRTTYEFSVELGSRLVESSKPFYLMTFSVLVPLSEERLREAIHAARASEAAVYAIDEARKRSVIENTEKEPVEAPPMPDQFMSSDDLPF